MTRFFSFAWFLNLSVCVGVLYTEELHLEVVDEAARYLPARVRVRDGSEVDIIPEGALKVPLGVDAWFVTDGTSELEVPVGELEIRVEHGPEFDPVKQTIVIHPNKSNRHRITLARFVNMRELGYLCGENHLHVPLPELAPQLVAEGLDFGTSLQWWNAKRFDTPTTGGYIRNLEFAGVEVPTTVFDYEIEHEWGAVYVIGQTTPLDADNEPDLPNFLIVQKSHEQGALVCYQGGWSREVLVDALLGVVDVVNVCNNNFLRHAYQPRSRYSNLLAVPGFPVYENKDHDMLRMNCETYYRLLNCGLRLAAGAGSATGPKKSPVGYNRVYVRMNGEDSLQSYLRRWREGRNFVTNGPMLFLRVDDQYYPGDTIEFDGNGGVLNAEVVVHSSLPLTGIEVIVNGQVVHKAQDSELSEKRSRISIEIDKGAWLAARCTAEDDLLSDSELAKYQWGTAEMPRMPSRLRFAHTSPLYVQVDGQGARVPESIKEAHAMLEAFAIFSRANASPAMREDIESALKKAAKALGSN